MGRSKLAQDIILKPIISERTMSAATEKKFTFEVDKKANKIEIARAVEVIFAGTKVKKVNTMNMQGRIRRRGADIGRTKSWKKAIVTLTNDSKTIEFFESMI